MLNLQLAGVGAEPALRNLCEALHKRLDDAAHFSHANKPNALYRIRPNPGHPSRKLGVPT